MPESTVQADARLATDAERFNSAVNRKPLGYSHNLDRLDLFQPDALAWLADRYAPHPHDYFVAGGADTPGTPFYSVQHGRFAPGEALRRLDELPSRVLLKRLENHDPRFRTLLDSLLEQILALDMHLKSQRIVRLESALFISSAATTTPFHFDPEINFFSQIEGEKEYHVYEPDVLGEPELERFYVCDIVDIAQVPLEGRDPAREHVDKLKPGDGFHQPQNAPHWVRTQATRSVSYSVVLVTEDQLSLSRSRAANHYLRKLGVAPRAPGTSAVADRAKAGVMGSLLPVRKGLQKALRRS